MPDDARAALRRYLEQRRDLGETELVLDRMSVDEAMRLLGAPAALARADLDVDVAAPADHPGLHQSEATAAPEEPPIPVIDTSGAPHGADWRAALRAADAAPARETPAPPSADLGVAPIGQAAGRDTTMPPSPDEPPVVPSALGASSGVDRWQIPGVTEPTGLVVGTESDTIRGAVTDAPDTLDALARIVADCTRCPLFRTATHPVPGEGDPNAELVVVGEAPGADEDASGRPFVGASGQLLTKILAAISLSREDVFICNVVKHRPPGNRNPEPDEVQACSPYLLRQLELVRPKAILTVGNFATQTLLGTKLGVSKLRGQVHRFHGTPLVATYHPAALLRNPTWKRDTWADVKLVRRILDRAQ